MLGCVTAVKTCDCAKGDVTYIFKKVQVFRESCKSYGEFQGGLERYDSCQGSVPVLRKVIQQRYKLIDSCDAYGEI